jgi:uncharacterized protein YecE (DUF72 family)
VPLYIGTSGWQYRHWRSTFYPKGVAQKRWLEFFAERFATVESNASFYRLPEADTFAAWAQRTPPDFVMAVKASRYLTHVKRLADPDDSVELFVQRAHRLGTKLGPVLIQLPPSLQVDVNRLRETLAAFPRGWRVAFEPRHKSWYADEVRELLVDRGAALCLADRRRPLMPDWRTADWGYIRFHGGLSKPPGCYTRDALARWVERIAELWPADADVYAYFNNDYFACALRDAIIFAELAAQAGLTPTRVPRTDDVTLGLGADRS